MDNPIDSVSWAWEAAGRHDRVGKAQHRVGLPTMNRIGVLHTSENSLVRSSAPGVAHWQNTQEGFVNKEKTDKRYSGYHFLADTDRWVGQCNPDNTRAYHAGNSYEWGDRAQPAKTGGGGGNNHIGLAMVARAARMPYNEEEDQFGRLLQSTATIMAHICQKYDVPLERISIKEYRQGKRGWLGHMDVATPHGRKSDPGEHFPWNDLMVEARRAWNRLYTVAAHSGQSAQSEPDKSSPGGQSVMKAQVGDIKFGPDEVKFLKDLAAKSLYNQVEAGSLSYATAVIRRLRIELGVEPSITASELAVRIADLLKKGRSVGQ